ncbi:MAG TPA: class I SAM-dependent methyltransferase [Gaiellaceae bacterium]|nr:class I SAM-dependent methyltransferase [Gaiellaceae bacterium]
MTGGGSSTAAVQELLRVLAAGRRVAEIGTAFGEGAAAMAETARELVTVEVDPERAEAARGRLDGFANVELLVGDWRELLAGRGPFELVFADGGLREAGTWEAALELMEVGGLLVKDDLTPGRPTDGDPVREFLLRDPRLAAVEILTTPETAAIVAARLS